MFRACLAVVVAMLPVSAFAQLDVRPYYNDSAWDRYTESVTEHDAKAIAWDKSALRPGQQATFANYTSYTRGLNGVAVLIGGGQLPAMQCRCGNSEPLGQWKRVRLPDIVERDGVAYLTWPEGLIRGKWLELNLGGELYYLGNAPAESGNSARNTFVDGSDFAGARDNARTPLDPAAVDDRYDYNRDGLVDDDDKFAAVDNATNFLTSLKLIAP